jgi:deoxyribonuclease V
MKIKKLHEWDLSPSGAVELQKQLAAEVVTQDRFAGPVMTVAGLDLGHDAKTNMSRSIVAVLNFPELELVESAEAVLPTVFPYVPGLLSFRETPVAIKALEKLNTAPDLLMVDGQGFAHPRRFGVACHVGVLADVPTIGVAKSILVGKHEDPGNERGSRADLIHRGESIGVVLRTKDNVRPLFISVGHRIRLETSVEFTLRCVTKYRQPEPTRVADKMASYRKV